MEKLKLYTEEQLKQLLNTVVEDMTDLKFNELLNESEIVSIELPSDEEISEEADSLITLESYNQTFKMGAKWMRDKIQGGNK